MPIAVQKMAHQVGISGESLLFDGQATSMRGLRLANGLMSDDSTDTIIELLPVYRSYGINSFSVFIQGNRFGDVAGYREDTSIDPRCRARLKRLLEAANEQAMMVVVGCLYWGHSRAKWSSWTEDDAACAVGKTAAWIGEQGFRHVVLDPDNEGMAFAEAGFNNHVLINAAKAMNPDLLVAINNRRQTAGPADLCMHHSEPKAGRPWIESEGSPPGVRYWGPEWSNPQPDEWYQYDHIGEYTQFMREVQIRHTFSCIDTNQGYLFASTWLQAAPPLGPNWEPGGMGTKNDPGIRWWLEAIRDRYGAYQPL